MKTTIRVVICAKDPCNPISEILQFSCFCYPAISIPLRNFLRLERRKTGKIAPKSYSCHRHSVSCAAADTWAYTPKKAATSPCWRCGFGFLRENGSLRLQGTAIDHRNGHIQFGDVLFLDTCLGNTTLSAQ